MKWLVMFLVFAGGVAFLVNQKKESDAQRIKLAQAKAEAIKAEEPTLPVEQAPAASLKFTSQTIATLRTLTEDTSDKVRLAAAELLWQMQDPQTDEIFKRMLETETEVETKRQLIDILQQQKTVRSLNLIAYALKDADKDIRIRAVEAIGSFASKEALGPLNAAMKDYDEEVKFKALKAVDTVRKDIEEKKRQQLADLEEKKRLAAQLPDLKVQ